MKSQRKESSEAMYKTMLLPRLMLPGSCNVNRPSNGIFAWHIGLLGKGVFWSTYGKQERRRSPCRSSPFFLISYLLNFTPQNVNSSSHLICILWPLKWLSKMSHTMISYAFLPRLKITRRHIKKPRVWAGRPCFAVLEQMIMPWLWLHGSRNDIFSRKGC